MKQPHGNGSGKTNVHIEDMSGWVRVFTDKQAYLPEEFGFYMSHALTEWFRQHPHLLLRTIVPVVRDGNTVELHAWYSQHTFPSPAKAKSDES